VIQFTSNGETAAKPVPIKSVEIEGFLNKETGAYEIWAYGEECGYLLAAFRPDGDLVVQEYHDDALGELGFVTDCDGAIDHEFARSDDCYTDVE